MKTAEYEPETIVLDKIEKTTTEILKKINCIRPGLFSSNLKFSKKAEEEKKILFKELIPKKVFSIDKTIELVSKIAADTNFLKLRQIDQDFISGLKKIDLKNTQYISEINNFITQENEINVVFFSLVEENLYFTYLNSELYEIKYTLDQINPQP
jgi:hypothetical protein